MRFTFSTGSWPQDAHKLVFITSKFERFVFTPQTLTFAFNLKHTRIDYLVIQLYIFREKRRRMSKVAASTTLFKNPQTGDRIDLTKTKYLSKPSNTTTLATLVAESTDTAVSFFLVPSEVKSTYKASTYEKGLRSRYKPIHTFLTRVNMPPAYFDEKTRLWEYGFTYFTRAKLCIEPVPEPIWISLFRKIFDRSRSKALIPKNFSAYTLDEIVSQMQNQNRIEPIYYIVDVIAASVSQSPYICDEFESFDDIFENRCGDCEDYAKGHLMVFEELKRAGKRLGASRFLKSVFECMQSWQCYACLGAVGASKHSGSFSAFSAPQPNQSHMFTILKSKLEPRCILLEGTALFSYTGSKHSPFYKNLILSDAIVRINTVERETLQNDAFYCYVVNLFTIDEAYLVVDRETQKIYGAPISKFIARPNEFVLVSVIDNAEYQRAASRRVQSYSSLPLLEYKPEIVYQHKANTAGEVVDQIIVRIDDFDDALLDQLHRATSIVSVVKEDKMFLRVEFII